MINSNTPLDLRNSLYKMAFCCFFVYQLLNGFTLQAQTISPAGPTTFCAGGSVVLTVSPITNITGYQWKKDGNDISGATTASYTVDSTGSFSLTLKRTSPLADTTIGTLVVTVKPRPNVTITSSANNFCSGLSSVLTATGADTYVWTPATGLSVISGATANANPTITTTYTVTGTTNGCTDNGNILITVKPRPTASFSYNPTTGCLRSRRKLFFNSTSSVNGSGSLTYLWNFGDNNSGSNNTSTSPNPSHSFVGTGFSNAQSFTVQLTVTGSNGCSTTTSQTISIGQFPDATLVDPFNFPEFKLCNLTNNTLTVVNSSTTKSINTLYQISWGDGVVFSSTTMDSLAHPYSSTGFKNLLFVVTSGGCKDSTEYSVYIGSNPAVGLSTDGFTTYLCVPSTKTFYIDTLKTSKNPLGTIYTVTFNDGSPDLVFPHPPPSEFNHTFTSSSCGAPNTLQANTFVVTIYASNPCGTTPGNVGGITTVLPPKANFSISPDTIVCTNSITTFTNTSTNGSVVTTIGSGPSVTFKCDSSKSVFWSIAAITGVPNSWTTTSNLGFLQTNVSGDQAVNFNFSQPGRYEMTLIVRNNANAPGACRSDTTKKTICVQSPPIPSFTATPLLGCNPLQVNFTNTSTNLPTCGPLTRKWIITKTGATCLADSTRDYVYTSGTDSTSNNPIIRFNNQGTYNVTLTITNVCGPFTTPTPQVVTVKRKPQVDLTVATIICAGQTITPTINPLPCGGTNSLFSWTFTGGTPATYSSGTMANPGTITYPNSGTFPIVVNVTNECGITTVNRSLRVNPIPVANAGNTASFCSGGSASLGTTALNGVKYSWSPATGLSATNIANPTVTLTNTGSTANTTLYTVIVTDTATNCSSQDTVSVTVKPLPSVTVSPTSPSICSGKSTTLTAIGADTYTWSPTSGLSAATGAVVTANPLTAATYTVTGTNSITGCSDSATASITVNALPSVAVNSPTICTGLSATLTATGADTYTWSPGGGLNSTSINPVTASPSVTSSYIVTGNNTTTGCTNTATATVTVNTLPTITVNSATICAGKSATLTAGGADTYSWLPTTNLTPTTGTTVTANPSNTTNYIVTGTTTSTGCKNTATSSVTVNQLPAAPTVTNISYCQGNTASPLTASATGTNTLNWYSVSSGGTTLTGAPTPSTTSVGTVTYYVSQTITATGCEGPRAAITVTVKATPVINATATNPTSCTTNTGSINITGLTPNTTYSYSYTKAGVVVTNTFSTPSSATNFLITGLSSGTYSSVSVTLNGCVSNIVASVSLADPNPPATPIATTNSPVCSGKILTLGASSTSAGVTYNWSGPNNYSSSSQNPSMPNVTVAAAGIYSVTATLNGCTSEADTISVVINQTPVTPTVSSNSPVCTDSTLQLIASTSSTMAVSWSWTSSNGFTSNLQNPTIANVTSAAAGIYSVTATATQGSCISAIGTTSVVVNPTSKITSSSANNPNACSSPTGSIILNGLTAGGSYTVNYQKNGIPQTATLTAGSGGVIIIENLAAGSYSNIYVVQSNCPSNTVGPFVLSDPTRPVTPVATSTGPVCSGKAFNLDASTTSSGTATYTWSGPNGFISTDKNPSITNVTTAASGTYTVSVAIAACRSFDATVVVRIDSTPVTPTVSSNAPVCTDSTIQLIASTSSTMAVSWNWTGVNSFSSAQQNPTIANVTTAAAGTYFVNATATQGNCISAIGTTSVVVNPTPKITGNSSINPNACGSSTGSIILNGLTTGGSYTVNYQKNGTPQTATIAANSVGVLTIANLAAATYSNIYVVQTGCPSNTVGPFELKDPTPPVTPVATTSTGPVCSGKTLDLKASTTSTGIANYNWNGPNGFMSTNQNSTITNVVTAASGTYTVSVTIAACKSADATVLVQIDSTPVKPIASSNSPVCTDSTLQLKASTSSTMTVSWNWTGVNSFSSTLQNPTIANVTAAAAGSYSVTATATQGSCISAAGTTVVAINLTPKITDSSAINPNACGSPTGSIILKGLIAGISYTVNYKKNSVLKDTTITASAGGSITILNLTAATYSEIYVVQTGCPSNTVGPFVLSDPTLPAAPIATSNSPVCSGQSIKIFVTSPISNASFTWTGPNSFNQAGTASTVTITNATVNAAGDYSVTTTLNNCTSLPTIVPVVVNPTPAAPVVNTPVVYCQLQIALPLTATAIVGNTLNWYTTATLGTASSVAPIPLTTNIGSTAFYVSQTTTQNCEGARAAINVIINPTPVVADQTDTICSGATFTITPTGAGIPANTTYAWSLPVVTGGITNATTGNDAASISGNLKNPTDSIQTATYTVTPKTGNCSGIPFKVTITVNPAPHVNFSPTDQTICSEQKSSLVSLTTLTPNASISWKCIPPASIEITGVITGGTTSIPEQTLINLTTQPIRLTYKAVAVTTGSFACPGDTSFYYITVNPTPVIADTTLAVCSENQFNFIPQSSVAGNIIPAGTICKWTVSANANITGQSEESTGKANIDQTLKNSTNTAQQLIYTITPMIGIAGNCTGQSFKLTITVNPLPAIADTAVEICSGSALSVTPLSSVAGNIIPAGTKYIWTVSNNTNLSGQSNVSTQQATIAQTLVNSTNIPQQLTYRVTPISDAASNCTGLPFNVLVSVNPTPKIANATAVICSDSSFNVLPINATTGNIIPAGTTYTWTVAANTNVTGQSNVSIGQNSIGQKLKNLTNIVQQVVYTATPKSGLVGNCIGLPFTITVSINPTPNVADDSIVICSGTSFQVSPLTGLNGNIVPNGITYSWAEPVVTGGVTGGVNSNNSTSITGNLNNPTADVQTATYTIIPVADGCPGNPFKLKVSINPSPTIQFTEPNQTICSNTTTKAVDLKTATVGAIKTWTCTIPLGITGAIASGSNTIPAQTLINTTNIPITLIYIAKATTAGTAACAGADAKYTIIVNPSPKVEFSADQTLCSGSQTTVVNITSATPDVVITWTSIVPSGITGALANGGTSIPSQILINTTTAPLTVKYLIKATTIGDAVCDGEVRIFSVIVNPTPDVKATPAAQTICSASATNIALSSSVTGTTYSWSFTTSGNVSGAAAGSGNSIAQTLVNSSTSPQTVTYTVRPSNTSNGVLCDGASFTVVITVNPKATISNNPLSQATCTNVTTNEVVFNSNSGGASYSWRMINAGGITGFIPDGTGNLPAMMLTNAGNTQATIVYSVNTTVDNCPGAPVDYKIVVNPDAKASFSFAQDTACWPFAISIQNTSPATPNGSYNWFADNIAIGTANNFPGYTIPAPSNTVQIKMVTISLYGCKNDSAIHRFFTKPKPAPLFTASDTVGCGPLLVNFINKTPLIDTFQYRWDFANGQTSTLQQPGGIIFKSNPTFRDTTYIVKLYAFNECDTQVFRMPILVKSKPNAIFTADKTTGCSPMTVTFTNGSIGDGMGYKWIYADGDTVATNSSAPIKHTFNVANQTTFPVKMIAFNNCGADTFTLNIVVTPNTIKLNFSIDGNTVSGCIPHTIRIVNNSVGGNLFVWDFGDGNTYNSVNNIEIFTHTYYQSGTFQVSARAINTCSDTTASRTVLVLQKPIPNYTVTYSANCIGDTISFTNITDTATAYSWSFGDGSFSNAINPKHFYATPGNYTVKLYARLLHPNGQVCLDSIQKQILIVDRLPGSFTVSDSVGNCTPFTVSFSNQSLPAVSTTWLFGDNTSGTGNNINHTYTTVGTYIATMTAIDPGGCRYEFSKKIVAGGPNGTFSYTKNTVCGPVPVRFEATAFLTDSLRWNFGDGTIVTSTNRIVYHTYQQPGVYMPSVELLAGTAASCRILLKGTDTLKVDFLQAGFNKAALAFCDSTRVSFIDSSYAFSGIKLWQWNLGDGSTANTQNVVHTYTTSNDYPVNHIITSNWGCSDTSSIILPVKVAITPVAQINLTSKGCIRESIELKATINSVDSFNLIKWTVSNGISGNGNNFKISFSQPGTYSIRLQIGTVNGCYDTATTSIIINNIPNISASDNQRICKGQSIQLQAGESNNYQWGPLVGLSCYTCDNPIATPEFTTDYIVSTINAEGCRNADTVTITVIQPFKMTVSPNDTICIGQSATLTVSGASNYTWSPAATLSCATCPNPIAKPVLTTLYRVVGNDNFNCFTDTAYTVVAVGLYPTVTLASDKILSTGTLLPLSSTVTNGPIRNYNWNSATDLSCSDCPLPIATIKKDICYVVKATTFYGCSATDTICIKVFCESAQVFIPNTFTPDGDGINDILMVRATGIKQVKRFTVFNRWGEIVFEKTNFSPNIPSVGWDGKVRGVKASPDVYVYMAEVICENDLRYTYKGNVTIIN